jgi:hypothetical protein
MEARFANLPPCLVGMEACVGAHHLSRKLNSLGRAAGLMPAKYVRPYSKGQKNDFRDAEAIALANKLARIAWSVLARGRAFEARKMDWNSSRAPESPRGRETGASLFNDRCVLTPRKPDYTTAFFDSIGQTRKSSIRAHVFRCSSKNGH